MSSNRGHVRGLHYGFSAPLNSSEADRLANDIEKESEPAISISSEDVKLFRSAVESFSAGLVLPPKSPKSRSNCVC